MHSGNKHIDVVDNDDSDDGDGDGDGEVQQTNIIVNAMEN